MIYDRCCNDGDSTALAEVLAATRRDAGCHHPTRHPFVPGIAATCGVCGLDSRVRIDES